MKKNKKSAVKASERPAVDINISVSPESEKMADDYKKRFEDLVEKVLKLTLDSGFEAFIFTAQDAEESRRLSTSIGTNDPGKAVAMMNCTMRVMNQFMRHTGAFPDVNMTAPGGIA